MVAYFVLAQKNNFMEKTIRTTRPMVVDQMLKNIHIPNGSFILEPSAGTGDLVDGIHRYVSHPLIDCIELNKERCQELERKGYRLIGYDFLTHKPTPIYDYVIATPTYKDNVDIMHIMHMYEFLKPGGVIISLTHPAWTTHNGDHQRKFREWLKDKDYSLRMLEDMSFVENYETQPSMIIKIKKHE